MRLCIVESGKLVPALWVEYSLLKTISGTNKQTVNEMENIRMYLNPLEMRFMVHAAI